MPIIRDPAKVTEDSDAVFYFPGCGSERLFGQVGLATQAMLYHAGAQCVLPPGYLCCGYPQTSAGRADKGEEITIRNRVLFHRVANTLNYLDIKTVVVSCGTCMDQLQKLRIRPDLPRLPAARHPRVPDGEGPEARGREGRALHVPRPLPHADEDPQADQGRQRAHGPGRFAERPLLRRVGYVRGQPARHRHPGALPQGGGDGEGRREGARGRLRRAR